MEHDEIKTWGDLHVAVRRTRERDERAGRALKSMLKHDPGRIRDEDATLAANSHLFLPVRADSRQTLPRCFEFTRSGRWWMDGTLAQTL